MLPTLTDGRVTLRPLADADLEPLAAIVAEPSVARWWGPLDDPDALRDELRNDGAAFTVEARGEPAGWLGLTEERIADYRSAGLDIVLASRFQDRGLGPAALRLAIGWLVGERGHHRLTIDPAADNARAIAAYRRVGFRPVGIMRAYERGHDGSFHDNLLMDLLADEVPRPGASFARLSRDGAERFQPLRRQLGVRAFGMNLIRLEPGQRGRVHAHHRQEEVYLVIDGVLTLVLEDGEHRLEGDDLARVGPSARRQLVNRGPAPLILLALGGEGGHAGRDGTAWPSWDDHGPGRPPQEVPLPDDLPPGHAEADV